MVFLANLSPIEGKIVYGLFGVQYTTLNESKKTMITILSQLLSTSASKVDTLVDESHSLPKSGYKTTTFIAYWLNTSIYDSWAESAPVQEFWESLGERAGVWKEVMKVPKSRYMYAASQELKWGLATMLELEQSSDEGYWGVYRHRLAANPDSFTDPEDKFTSPYVTTAKAKPGDENLKVLDISKVFDGEIVKGRVKVENPPENLVFVREGQKPFHVPPEEREMWLEQISPHAQSWIENLDQERNKNGVVAFSSHARYEKNETANGSVGEGNEVLAETDQLVYFLDLAHFELAGRAHKGHVELRKNVMTLYGPGGKLSKGKSELYVELCVLKAGDLDAEYFGCYEGTGLIYLGNL